MGYNTTVVVLNDALHLIEQDPEFGKKLARAIRSLSLYKPSHGVDVSSHGHLNAATAIETHHADATAIVAVGGNHATKLATVFTDHHDDAGQLECLKQLANHMGYRIVKKAQPKSVNLTYKG